MPSLSSTRTGSRLLTAGNLPVANAARLFSSTRRACSTETLPPCTAPGIPHAAATSGVPLMPMVTSSIEYNFSLNGSRTHFPIIRTKSASVTHKPTSTMPSGSPGLSASSRSSSIIVLASRTSVGEYPSRRTSSRPLQANRDHAVFAGPPCIRQFVHATTPLREWQRDYTDRRRLRSSPAVAPAPAHTAHTPRQRSRHRPGSRSTTALLPLEAPRSRRRLPQPGRAGAESAW